MCRRRFHNVVLWRNHMTYKTNHREVRDIVLCFHFTAGLFSLSYCTTCCPHHEPRLLTVSKMTPSHTAKATIKVHYLKCHVCVQSLSCVQLFVIPWTTVHQAPLSMGFSRQEYRMGSHALLQGIFPTQGSNPGLLHCRQILYPLSHQGSPP